MLCFTVQVDESTRRSLECEVADLVGAVAEGNGSRVTFADGSSALVLEKLSDIALQHTTEGVPVPAFLV